MKRNTPFFWKVRVLVFFIVLTKYLRPTGEERFILAHSYRGFSLKSAGSIALGLQQGRNIKMEGHSGGNCSPHGIQEAEREGQERTRDKICLPQ
jgi:hypothetical protein